MFFNIFCPRTDRFVQLFACSFCKTSVSQKLCIYPYFTTICGIINIFLSLPSLSFLTAHVPQFGGSGRPVLVDPLHGGNQCAPAIIHQISRCLWVSDCCPVHLKRLAIVHPLKNIQICRNGIPVNILVIQSVFSIAFSQILQFHSVIFESAQYHRKARRNRNWRARITANPGKFRKIYRLQPSFML